MKIPNSIAELMRRMAGVRKPSPWHLEEDSDRPGDDGDEQDYAYAGSFTEEEAETVLAHLQREKMQFRIVCDTTAGRTGRSGGSDDRQRVDVFVHQTDFAEAQKFIDDWRIAVGKVTTDEG